jgi:hypothetical protein
VSVNNIVVILADSEDVHARAVAAEIEKFAGWKVVVLDTADYPTRWQLSFSIKDGEDFRYCIHFPDGTLSGDAIASVWWRRVHKHEIPPAITDSRFRQFCLDEARAAFEGWICSLGDRVVNPRAAEFAANQKSLQLVCAVKAGLLIPETLITNSVNAARNFLEPQQRGVIFKALTGTSWQFTETREFEAAHFDHLSKLCFAPAIFQEKIECGTDIRITIVDEQFFAVAVRPNHPGAKLDWRLDLSADISPFSLPSKICAKLLVLMRLLGIRFGAVDMRVNRREEYIFLEVNPGGQFLFCEIHAGQPISAALAKALMRPSVSESTDPCRIDRFPQVP